MLERYLQHPLANAPNARRRARVQPAARPDEVRGFVDRVCEIEGGTTLVDYKTNATLDHRLIGAYSMQLRLYGLAARRVCCRWRRPTAGSFRHSSGS